MQIPANLGPLDARSFELGMIYAFAEVVASGCKPMAYSPPLEPGDLAEVLQGARSIAQEFAVLLHHDTGFLPSLLFNPAFTTGREVLVLARDQATLDAYLALQRRQREAQAEAAGGTSHLQIARELGLLLGYEEVVIENLLRHPRF